MALDTKCIRAIVFDYGNTLIPFGRAQLDAYDAALSAGIEAHYGPFDTERFNAFRMESRLAPYQGDSPSYRENDFESTTVRLIRELFGREPSKTSLGDLLRLRLDVFVDTVTAEDQVSEILARLRSRFALGLLSNYPDGAAIRASLDRTGLTPYFESIVVSGEVGYVKPHPIVFATTLEQLGLSSGEVLFVGDNWLADIQGAKRAGMQAVHMRRWTPPEVFDPAPGDHRPDAEIRRLEELESLLSTNEAPIPGVSPSRERAS